MRPSLPSLALLFTLASCAELDDDVPPSGEIADHDLATPASSVPIDPRLRPPVPLDLADPAQHGVLDGPIPPPTRPVAPAGERPLHEVQLRTESGVVTVVAEEVGDLLIAEGDIIVGRVDALTSVPDGAVALAAITDLTKRWDGGIVPFVIDPTLSPALTPTINASLNALQAATPVRFVPRTTEVDFLVFVPSRDAGASSSWVGRQGDRQEVQLDSMATQRTVTHEVMHALGVFHEQSRIDRDAFVAVDEACMQPGRGHNYRKELGSTARGPYDFASIMHYDSRFFCRLVPGTGRTCECLPLRRVSSAPCANCTDLDGDGFAEAVVATLVPSVEDINGLHHMYRPVFASETLDRMGESVASGDFDRDGYDDLAVGAPLEAITPGGPLSGVVYVYKGTAEGLVPWRLLTQQGVDLDERLDKFGAALAVRRMPGGDGLLVGAPGETVDGMTYAGAVYEFRTNAGTALVPVTSVRRGRAAGDLFGTALAAETSATGFLLALAIGAPGRDVGGTDAGAVHLEGHLLSDGGLRDVIEGTAGQRLGTSVAWGRLAPSPDNYFSLAAGAPGHRIGTIADVGAVYLWYVVREGAGYPALRPWTYLVPSWLAGGKVGQALAIGDFDRNGRDDLAVGAPGAGAGAAYWYRGRSSNAIPPWAPELVRRLDQGSMSPAVDGERFGTALAATDLDGDGDDDLLVGAPSDRNGDQVAAGAVFWFQSDGWALAAHGRISQAIWFGWLDDERASDGFGTALAPHSSRGVPGFAVGAPGEDFGSVLEAGGAFTFAHVTWPFTGMVGVEFVHQDAHSFLSE